MKRPSASETAGSVEIECPLRSAARDTPHELAVIAPDRSFSYAELEDLVSAAASEFVRRGWGGGRVSFLLEPSWCYAALILAAVRAGATACPLSTRLPADAVEERRRMIGAFVLISDRAEYGDAVHPDALLNATSSGRHDTASSSSKGRTSVLSEQPATIVFTSGSTGRSRAALHTFGNHYFSADGSNRNIRVGPGDRWLLSLPLYHVGGVAILFRCFLGRAAVLFPNPDEPISEAVRGATHVSLVATQLRRLLVGGTLPVATDSLKAVLLGGSAIPAGLVEESWDRDLPVHTSYGLTEMSSQVAATPPGASLDVLQTSGRILPHRELRVDDSGEILVRGRTRFVGYVDADEIEYPFDEDGWFATGDLGRIDEKGFLHILGRIDNMFISGGENIHPEEIEAVLMTVPGVSRVAVVPVDDEEFGARPVAFVQTQGRTPDADALEATVEAVLPRFMVPIAFHPWPSEENEGIKADRAALRRKAAKLRAGG